MKKILISAAMWGCCLNFQILSAQETAPAIPAADAPSVVAQPAALHDSASTPPINGCADACLGDVCGASNACPLFGDEPLLGFLKGQPLADCWTYSVGGQLRYRYMDEDNRLRPGGPGRSTYNLWRFTPFLQVQRGDDFTGYVQAIDASIFNQDLPITGIDQNRADLLQYYIDVKVAEGDGDLRFRYGRQFLKYGSQHLVSPLAWSNTFRNFEGFKLYYASEDWNIDGFATQPVNAGGGNIFRPEQADHPDQSRWFSGIYTTYKGVKNQTIDFYWLWLNEDQDRVARIDGNRHTIGARWDGKQPINECGNVVATWLWDLEAAYQFGSESFRGGVNEDIQAGFLSGMVGYTFNDAPWTPTIKGVFWYGSGDNNPGDGTNNTVSTLYPLGHAYWGIIDNLNGQNLLDYSIQAALKPTKKLSLAGQLHWFAKAEASDPIYNVAGASFPNPAAPGTASKNIGSELDLIATYQVNKNLQFQAGYSLFWYGGAVTQDVINRGDANQFYFMATLGF